MPANGRVVEAATIEAQADDRHLLDDGGDVVALAPESSVSIIQRLEPRG